MTARADDALRRHFKKRFSGYRAFADVWREAYALHEVEIMQAIRQLPGGKIFMRLPVPSDADIVATAMQPWFIERVFDSFLWEMGTQS